MKCPKCGSEVRPSKKYPGDYLCDKCKIRYRASSVIADNTDDNTVPRKKKHPFLIIFLVLLLLVAAAAGAYYSGLISFEEPAVPQDEVIDIYAFGKTASLNEINFNVRSVGTVLEYDALVKPSPGKAFLLIEAEITNNSDSPVNINSTSNFELYFADELIPYSSSAYEILTSEQIRLTGTIEPDSSISGCLCYEVPEDWTDQTPTKLQFTTPVWSLHKVQIELNN